MGWASLRGLVLYVLVVCDVPTDADPLLSAGHRPVFLQYAGHSLLTDNSVKFMSSFIPQVGAVPGVHVACLCVTWQRVTLLGK